MADLTIRIKKKSDGSAALTVIRADGSTSWQQQNGPSGQFFPLHDMTHYAVETVLGHKRGFYGLMAEGWEFSDFGDPWPRGPIPEDAEPSELIVGLFDAERATGSEWTAEQLKQMAADFVEMWASLKPTWRQWQQTVPQTKCEAHLPSDSQLSAIRELRDKLFARWHGLVPGESMELEFART